ncbi:MAG: ribonuclease D [Planctomycetota bacterium]|nr:ribonuclease D [Planctomycetota bacterium]
MPRLVDTKDGLDDCLAALAAAPALAVDTETDAFFAYRPAICLLQASTPDEDFLIDPLADLDLAPFGAILADPAREVVLHAAENDVILMHHQFGWRIGRLFDTQVASFVLGLKPYSLAGVLEARFEVKLDKSQQRSDWARRPLTDKQVEYAALDTHYLLRLAAELRARAVDAGRVDEIEWECGRIATREWTPEPFDPEGFRRMSAAKEMDARDLRVLQELFLFREAEAERRNRAPYRVVPDHALVALTRWRKGPPPRGVPERFWQRYGGKVRRTIETARKKGPLPPRKRHRRRDGEPTSPAVKQRYERLRRWRARAAEERGVESFVVARNELLMRVARSGAASREELAGEVEPFRLREYGDAILAALLDSA